MQVYTLSLSSNSWCRLLRFLYFFCSPNSLLSLSLPNIGLLISFRENVLKCGSNNSSLKLLSSFRTFLRYLFFNTFSMLSSIEHCPCNFTWVSFQEVSFVASTIQEFERLAVLFDQGSTPSRVDLVTAIRANFDLHD